MFRRIIRQILNKNCRYGKQSLFPKISIFDTPIFFDQMKNVLLNNVMNNIYEKRNTTKISLYSNSKTDALDIS